MVDRVNMFPGPKVNIIMLESKLYIVALFFVGKMKIYI